MKTFESCISELSDLKQDIINSIERDNNVISKYISCNIWALHYMQILAKNSSILTGLSVPQVQYKINPYDLTWPQQKQVCDNIISSITLTINIISIAGGISVKKTLPITISGDNNNINIGENNSIQINNSIFEKLEKEFPTWEEECKNFNDEKYNQLNSSLIELKESIESKNKNKAIQLAKSFGKLLLSIGCGVLGNIVTKTVGIA